MNEVEEKCVRSILAGEMKALTEGKAQPGKFQVVVVDTFNYDRAVACEVDDLHEAIRRSEALIEGHQMIRVRVYDDAGEERFMVEHK